MEDTTNVPGQLKRLADNLRDIEEDISHVLDLNDDAESLTDDDLANIARRYTHGKEPYLKAMLWGLRWSCARVHMTDADIIALAAELAEGDEVVREILEWEMRSSGGRGVSAPHLKDGIYFWMVGHNASHQFYAGTKNGKRYRYSCGEGLEEGEIDISPVEEVADWSGYYGHF